MFGLPPCNQHTHLHTHAHCAVYNVKTVCKACTWCYGREVTTILILLLLLHRDSLQLLTEPRTFSSAPTDPDRPKTRAFYATYRTAIIYISALNYYDYYFYDYYNEVPPLDDYHFHATISASPPRVKSSECAIRSRRL